MAPLKEQHQKVVNYIHRWRDDNQQPIFQQVQQNKTHIFQNKKIAIFWELAK
jgi:hypothetical protein